MESAAVRAGGSARNIDRALPTSHRVFVIRAFILGVRQLSDPRILTVLAKSMTVTLMIFALLGAVLWWVSNRIAPSGIAALIAVFVALLAVWLLFRIVAIAVIGLFGDEIVLAVEARHYPSALVTARSIPLSRSFRMGLGSAGRAVLINAAILPIYITLLVTGVGTAIAFLAVNGWLLGRDLGDMVAVRHLDDATMRRWRATTGMSRFMLGLAATGLFMVPVINIIAPVLGAAMATHLFHARRP